ncbi:MAG: hypothetical protein ACE5KE_11585 [Methanosarcinales archaeon]
MIRKFILTCLIFLLSANFVFAQVDLKDGIPVVLSNQDISESIDIPLYAQSMHEFLFKTDPRNIDPMLTVYREYGKPEILYFKSGILSITNYRSNQITKVQLNLRTFTPSSEAYEKFNLLTILANNNKIEEIDRYVITPQAKKIHDLEKDIQNLESEKQTLIKDNQELKTENQRLKQENQNYQKYMWIGGLSIIGNVILSMVLGLLVLKRKKNGVNTRIPRSSRIRKKGKEKTRIRRSSPLRSQKHKNRVGL